MSAYLEYLGPDGYGTYEVNWGPTPTFQRVCKHADGLLVPGFVDIHFHGAFGMDFMSASTADLLALADKLAKEGYEAFLPTTVTASLDEILSALRVLPEHPMIPGFHLEGPFINPQVLGAQPNLTVTPPLVASPWDEAIDHPKLKVVTLAPEIPNALEFISRLRKRDVVVSMGHSWASFEEARRGFEFGATHMTHMFNAMRPFHHREIGLMGYALMNDAIRCELIYDRIHVAKEAAQLLLKLKGPDRIIAISDSSAATRLAAGMEVTLWGQPAVADRDCVRLKSNGALAGSTITLLDAFRNLHDDFGPELAIKATSHNPRKALGMTGDPRVLVEMDRNLQIRTIYGKGGQISSL